MKINTSQYPINRKHWEWCAISQALYERGMLAPSRIGIGFAVGREPLPSLFASLGATIIATDMPNGEETAWSSTGQHSSNLKDLFNPNIVEEKEFERLVSYQGVDMTKLETLPTEHFDFAWSSCAFEHLGSLENGLTFVKNAMRTLKIGGVAVHTTEFNCSSNEGTISEGSSVIYRRRDLEQFSYELRHMRVVLEPFDFDTGTHIGDIDYDTPPYGLKPYHLKLEIDGYVSTSIILIATRRG